MNHAQRWCQTCLIISCALLLFNCKKDTNSIQSKSTLEETKIVSFQGHSNRLYHANLVTPEGNGPYPVVIVLHGCGGLYSDPATHTMDSHFNDWITLFQQQKIVALFLDSYHYPRNIDSFCNKAPMDDAACSPAYERPKDVADAIKYLSTLAYVDKNRIGLLGFSQGAETAVSAMLNTTVVTKNTWTVNNGGSTYNGPSPAIMPNDATIKTAVAYYPGLGFYNYYGSSSNPNDGAYLPVSPVLIYGAELDPLYTSGTYQVFAQRAINSGSSSTTNNQVEIITYQGADHSFDGETTGANGTANSDAKQYTLQWFKTHL